jgi:hypothetical protein
MSKSLHATSYIGWCVYDSSPGTQYYSINSYMLRGNPRPIGVGKPFSYDLVSDQFSFFSGFINVLLGSSSVKIAFVLQNTRIFDNLIDSCEEKTCDACWPTPAIGGYE